MRLSPLPTGFAAAALGAGSLLAGVATTVPADAAAVAAVFPPWWTASRALDAAAQAGDVLRLGSSPHVVIVRSRRPDLGERLRRAGALVLLNPLGAGACEPSSPRRTPT